MSSFKKTFPLLLATAGAFISFSSSARADAAADQIAMQLGAIQLGYSTPYNPSADDLTNGVAASILKQGQLALATTTANFTTTAYVVKPGTTNPTVVANPQTDQFRGQYLAAVQNALANPTTATIPKTTVSTYNPVSKRYIPVANVTGTLTPAATTPSTILSAVIADMPNFAPDLVGRAVSATMAGATNSSGIFIPTWGAAPKPTAANLSSSNNINVFNQKTAATQLSNAGKAASAALTAACKAYAAGTVNWQKWPVNGVTNSNGYLPNFGLTTNGPKGGSANQIQTPDLKGLADAASAVAANAINGLGAVDMNNPSNGLYGKTQVNVQSIAQQMINAAKAFQATSTSTKGGLIYGTGSLGAASFGLITQVAGYQQSNGVPTSGGNQSWGAQGSPDTFTYLLNGVVRGAVAAVGATNLNFLKAIATGVAQGFTAAYLQTQYNADKTTIMSLANFSALNTQQITQAFSSAGVSSSVISQLNSLGSVSSGIANTYGCFDTNSGIWSFGSNNSNGLTIAGAPGINLGNTNNGITPLINGVGSPVTDTTGL